MRRLRFTIALLTLLGLIVANQVIRGNVAGGIGPNGEHARPFYNIAHNPNEPSEATSAIEHGANGLEPDVMRFQCPLWNALAGDSGLYMYHDFDSVPCVTTRVPTTVEAYLDNLHTLVKADKNLAIITFDIKPEAATYLKSNNAEKLRRAVREHLNYDGVNVNIIYSVASTDDADDFFKWACLGPREGTMVDANNDPAAVYNYLLGENQKANVNCGRFVPANFGYGNGSIGESFGLAPNVIKSIDYASWIRAAQPVSFAIAYAFPIVVGRVDEYINAGTDGLIVDEDRPDQHWDLTLLNIDALTTKMDDRSDIYPATPADNPFAPPKEAYGLIVRTMSNDSPGVSGAGTNANLTFKLYGSCGMAEVTIDASYSDRFESAGVDFVTIQSKNLGILEKLELYSDSGSSGNGNKWNPGVVQVNSARWGIPYAANSNTVDFSNPDFPVFDGAFARRTLPGWGRECDVTPPSAAPSPFPIANAAGWNQADVTVTWNWTDNAGGSGIDPAHCTTSSTSSGEGTVTLTATCRDNDGNTGSASRTVYVDKTNPTVNCDAADGAWHPGDVSRSCSASDTGGSGLADSSNALFNLVTSVTAGTETAYASTGSLVVVDRAGNASTAGPITGNKVDKKAPGVSCGAADGQWHPANTSVACSSSDGGSGLATAADANFSLSTSVIAGTDNANAFTASYTVFDAVGNSSVAGPVGGNKVDRKAPGIVIVQPAATQYTHSATLTLNYGVTDSGSGLASVTPAMDGSLTVAGSALPNGRAIILSTSLSIGQHTFTIDAADTVGNNSSQASVTFTIIVTAESAIQSVNQFLTSGAIARERATSLLSKLNNALAARRGGQCGAAASIYAAFINEVQAQTGKTITPTAAAVLIADARYLIAHCP